VKRSYLLAVLAAGIVSLGLIAAYGVAQQPPAATTRAAAPPVRGGSIALIDVNYIFKNHAGFKALKDELNAEVEQAEAQVKRDRETLRKLAEELQLYKKGSPQYKQLEEQMAKLQADVSVRVQMQKKDFIEREAKIFHQVYQQIFQHVRYYAQTNGISAVLKFNGDPVDPSKPETILRDLNKPVVWYAEHLDITPVILNSLNQPGMSRSVPPSGPASRTGPTVPFNR